MYQHTEVVGLDCAAGILRRVGHCFVDVPAAMGRGGRDRALRIRQRVGGPDRKKASVESMICYDNAQRFRFQADPWIANLRARQTPLLNPQHRLRALHTGDCLL
jgi:hypothetical protein